MIGSAQRFARPDDAIPLLPEPVVFVGGGDAALSELEYESLRGHVARLGPRPSYRDAGHALLELAREADLRGRGGGHVAAAAKWQRARDGGGTRVVVANGAEGEPLSRKDVSLLSLRPHLVLDGLACVAEAVGAPSGVVWLHEENHAARAAVTRALAERRDVAGDVRITVRVGPGGYLSGESSAAARAVAGGPALPAFDARRPTDPRPTLVHNVESLARVALLARGLPDAAATSLLSVSGPLGIVVMETDESSSLADVVAAAGWTTRPRAVLLGGYGGSWAPWHGVAETPVAEKPFRRSGLSLGAGIIAPIGPAECGLARSAEIAAFLAAAGARQCGPCVHGLPELADALGHLAHHRWGASRRLRLLDEVTQQLFGRGACHHPDGAVRLVASALRVFADDVDAHRRGRCEATGRS